MPELTPILRRTWRGPDLAAEVDVTQTTPVEVGHARSRGIVLEELRVVYVPVPKTACTSILWSLAKLAGFKHSRFAASTGSEVTPSMTVHDLSRWPKACRLRARDEEWLEETTHDPSWLVFTVVREPTARLWSAWQSKLLFREPRFVRSFGQEPWFPRRPGNPGHVLQDFRRFVDAAVAGEARDPHWLPQTDLLASPPLPFDFVGHTEDVSATMRHLAEHLGREAPTLERRNESLLPAPWAVLASGVHDRAAEYYGADYETFGYPVPGQNAPAQKDRDAWHNAARALTPLLDQIIQRNQRIGQLHAALQHASQQSRTD